MNSIRSKLYFEQIACSDLVLAEYSGVFFIAIHYLVLKGIRIRQFNHSFSNLLVILNSFAPCFRFYTANIFVTWAGVYVVKIPQSPIVRCAPFHSSVKLCVRVEILRTSSHCLNSVSLISYCDWTNKQTTKLLAAVCRSLLTAPGPDWASLLLSMVPRSEYSFLSHSFWLLKCLKIF